MRNAKKQGFIRGAAILATAGMIVKIIGACYKIPLGAILGPVGMADFSIAYNIYALLFVFSTAGVPVAVSKMVSESLARADEYAIYRIYKVSYFAFALAGVIGFAVMFFGADFLAKVMGNSDAALSVKAISPAVIFVTLSAINRGYYQGRGNMYPTAISEILEAFGKLIVGLGFAWYIKRCGFGERAVSAGAVLGVSAGALFSAVYFAAFRDKTKLSARKSEVRSADILKKLCCLAVPITFGAVVISLSNAIDSALVMNLLQKNGMELQTAKWLFGAYSYATTIFNLPSALITTLSVSILPALSVAKGKRDYIGVDKTANSGLFMAMTIAIPAACGMFALSDEIINLLYGSGMDSACVEISGRLLRCISLAVPLLAFVTITNSIHQSLGNVSTPVVSMILGALVKLISNFMLVGRASVNIYGAAVSTVLCYLTVAIFNIVALKKYPFIGVDVTKIFARPILLGTGCFVSVKCCESILMGTFCSEIRTIFCIFVGVFVYVAFAFAMGVTKESRKNGIYKRKKIFKFIDND